MKRLNVLFLVIVMLFMAGCTAGQGQPQIQVDPEDQAVIGKITGRHAGNELAKHYPDIAKNVVAVCNDIINEDNPDIIVTLVKSVIITLSDSQIDDELLKADIKDIMELIKVKSGVEITKEQMSVIKAVAEGLVSGIKIATHNRRSEKFHRWDKYRGSGLR